MSNKAIPEYVGNPVKWARAEKILREKNLPVTEEATKEQYILMAGRIVGDASTNVGDAENKSEGETSTESKVADSAPRRRHRS
jgi:hypothetical protein